ncbi:unnamed protein product [Phytophthora fragariaefolia]|uniref:Unnamed protein product n=1 Tax=Phytophthora fragariaefolia TaxID=1490495 RepID=A0A9W7CPW9_9STRA|nr:unnamed protein product [Phytophthora fragariaefolia]
MIMDKSTEPRACRQGGTLRAVHDAPMSTDIAPACMSPEVRRASKSARCWSPPEAEKRRAGPAPASQAAGSDDVGRLVSAGRGDTRAVHTRAMHGTVAVLGKVPP